MTCLGFEVQACEPNNEVDLFEAQHRGGFLQRKFQIFPADAADDASVGAALRARLGYHASRRRASFRFLPKHHQCTARSFSGGHPTSREIHVAKEIRGKCALAHTSLVSRHIIGWLQPQAGGREVRQSHLN
jgi:hypothetical protein